MSDRDKLKAAIRDIHWMARRYADGRCSYAPGMFNGRVRDLMAAGFELKEPLFARDGMGRAFDGLTEDEVAAAEADMPRMHTKVIEAGEERFNEVWDKAVEACAKELENRAENHAQIAKDHDGWQQEILMAKEQSLAEIVGCIRSLKRLDKTEKADG